MNTVTSDVITMLESLGLGTFGEDLYCGRVPESKKVPTALWLLVPNGTYPLGTHNVTGEDTLNYNFRLYYRNIEYKEVDKHIFLATKILSGIHCHNLNNFKTIDINVGSSSGSYTTDTENRVVGYVAFDVRVYDIANSL